VEDVQVFFFKKNVIIWGIIILVIVLALIVLLRIAGSAKEVYQGMVAMLGAM